MILPHFSFVTACLITVILHASPSEAALDLPACFVIEVLSPFYVIDKLIYLSKTVPLRY